MKRYRVLPGDWDGRPVLMSMEIEDHREEQIKSLNKKNQDEIIKDFKNQFGCLDFDEKKKRYLELPNPPCSIVNEHNYLLRWIRNTYVSGYFYPALVASCTLGERILNTILFKLKNHYRHSKRYKEVANKESLQDWKKAISILSEWTILKTGTPEKPGTVELFETLLALRNPSVHFDSDLHREVKNQAFLSVSLISRIIGELFTAFGLSEYFIPSTLGACYIKKEFETHPFVIEFYVPCSIHVGPRYEITKLFPPPVEFIDDYSYPNRELTDSEFAHFVDNRNVGVI
jgi:hypothetical protein